MTTADALALTLDWHLDTGKVSIPGNMVGLAALQANLQTLLEAEGSEFALVEMSKGDSRPLDVGLFSGGRPLEVPLSSLAFALKEFETAVLYRLNAEAGDDFVPVQRDGMTRYRIPITFDAGRMQRVLQKYADPLGTFADVICELQLTANYKAAQASEQSGGPAVLEMPVDVEQVLEVNLPLDLANGETKQYTLSANVSNRGSNSFTTYDFNNDVEGTDHFRNVQSYSVSKTFTAAKAGDVITVTNGTISSPLKEFEQILRQYVAREVWMDRVTFSNILATDEGVKISCTVVTEAFQHPTLTLPETAWVADVVLPRLSHDKFGKNSVSTKWDFANGGSGDFWSDTCDIILLTGGAQQLAASIPRNTADGPEISSLISTAAGNFYVMAPTLPFSSASTSHRNKFRLFFPTAPAADSVRIKLDGDPNKVTDYAIQQVAVPTTAPIQLMASIAGQEVEEEEEKVARLSTSSFVARLRRDLIPDVAPDPGGS